MQTFGLTTWAVALALTGVGVDAYVPVWSSQSQLATPLQPVHWTVRAPTTAVAPGATTQVTVVAAIDAGWHIYSLTQKPGGPIALTLESPANQPVTIAGRVRGPVPETLTTSSFDIPVELYSGHAEFTVPIRLATATKAGSQAATIIATWQACSATTCLAPESLDLPIAVAVGQAPVRPAAATTALATPAITNATPPASEPSLAGLWDGVIHYDPTAIAFPLEFTGSGATLQVSFFNGKDRITSTDARLAGDSLVVGFAQMATQLAGEVKNGVLSAQYGAVGRSGRVVEARPHKDVSVPSAGVPDIAGTWIIPANSSKGEHAWRFVVQQAGATLTATVLRVDGDAGAHIGVWQDGRAVLNHFDGARPGQIVVSLHDGGGLDVTTNPTGRGQPKTVLALRPDVAVAQGLAEPADFATHTGVRDVKEPFAFSFPDLAGNLVSNTDATLAGKVVLVTIGGSWCPNCLDEAPFLTELYHKYHSQGFEVVALDFEEGGDFPDLTRLKAFIGKYKIDYTVLLAGQTGELHAKVPQAVNLDSWPTTFFLGRDGTVRAVHAGFAAPASGEFHTELRAEYTGIIERLLTEGGR